MKKTISILLVLVSLLSCLSVQSLAALPETAEPMWDNTASTIEGFDFDGTTGLTSMRVNGKRGTSQIDGIGTVYKFDGTNWVFVDEVIKSVHALSCYIEIEFQGEVGYEYKVDYIFVVYNSVGTPEIIPSTLYATCQ